MRFPDRVPGRIAAALLVGSLGACNSAGESSTGSTLSNLLRYGSTTEPPAATPIPQEYLDCPGVLVSENGASVRQGSSQLAIANVARQCIERPGGAVSVKVGIEGRALLGAGGGSARFDTQLTIVLKRGDRILASRVRRVSVAIPPGQTQASFTVIESDLIVPAGTGEFDIEVGFGSGRAAAPARRRRG